MEPMLDATERASFERTARERWAAGDLAAVAELVIRTYGPEVLGYLHAVTRDEADAGEAFAILSEDLWRGLPGFGWRSSLRTWLYVLARHASAACSAIPTAGATATSRCRGRRSTRWCSRSAPTPSTTCAPRPRAS
jgi:hypothetical protein